MGYLRAKATLLATLALGPCLACAAADEAGTLVWRPLPGDLTDIGVSVNGAMFAIGANVMAGGHSIHRWTGSVWKPVPGGGVRIAVDPEGNPWVVNDAGAIFRRKKRWEQLPGTATDVGIGADGTVWILRNGDTPSRWTGSEWAAIQGVGKSVAIAVGPKGEPWIVDAAGDIHRFEPDSRTWTRLPGKAQDVAVAADGTTFIVGPGPGTVSRLDGEVWLADPAAAGSRISAGAAGTVAVLKGGALFMAGTVARDPVPGKRDTANEVGP